VPVPAGEDPWTGEQLPATIRYAAWLADGIPAGGWDSYRYTVLTYGHDRYDTAAKAKNAVRRIHKQRAEYAAYARNHHTACLSSGRPLARRAPPPLVRGLPCCHGEQPGPPPTRPTPRQPRRPTHRPRAHPHAHPPRVSRRGVLAGRPPRRQAG